MRGLCALVVSVLVISSAAGPSVSRKWNANEGEQGVAEEGDDPNNYGRSKAFEFLLFAEQATEGYCRVHNCVEDKVRDFWTIHGLWPSNETASPENCDPADKFNPDEVADIRADLDKYWASVTAENSDSFWSHEWSKHGTCAKEISELSGQHNFFSYTLQLYQRWNLTRYFEQAGIFPDNEKTVDSRAIENALDEDLRGRVNIVCQSVHDLDYPVLTEVRFCLSKQLNIIDCRNKEQVCNEGPIYYL